jgi:hypothetical protein
MAKEPGRFQTSSGEQAAEPIMRQFQEAATNYFSWLQNGMSACPWGVYYATWAIAARIATTSAAENVTAAFAFVQRLNQAASLQDMVRIQAEFVQMQIDLFNTRKNELSEAGAAASNIIGAFGSLLRWRKLLDDMARNSPAYRETGREGGKRDWRAVS